MQPLSSGMILSLCTLVVMRTNVSGSTLYVFVRAGSYVHRLTSFPNLNQGGPSGENLAVGYANITAVVEAWGDERKMYNFDRPTGFSMSTGHFTQLIWKNTNSVGCGRVDCHNSATDGASGWLVVCEYWPAGNVIGDFKNQVQKRIKSVNGSGGAGGKHSVEWGFVVSGLVIALLVSGL